MKTYGLIGYPLGHSFSKKYFTEKIAREGIADTAFDLFPIEDIAMLPGLLEANPGIRGLNVTIPYKEKVIPYLDALDDEARAIGAVNCISVENGRLVGHNTDAHGFRASLLELVGDERPWALVLGTGGASKAVLYSLGQLGIDAVTVSRSPGRSDLTYGEITPEVIDQRRLIVNATPLGTFPDVEASPALPYDLLTAGHFLFDLVYNPPVTAFMQHGSRRGARVCNGYDMLVEQAEKAWRIWQAAEAANGRS